MRGSIRGRWLGVALSLCGCHRAAAPVPAEPVAAAEPATGEPPPVVAAEPPDEPAPPEQGEHAEVAPEDAMPGSDPPGSDPSGSDPPEGEPLGTDRPGTIGTGNTGLIGKGGNMPDGWQRWPETVRRQRVEVTGGRIDPKLFWRIVENNFETRFHLCYRKELNNWPDLAGKVVLQLVIAGDGTIDSVEASGDPKEALGRVGDCFARAVRMANNRLFPIEGRVQTSVTVQLRLSPEKSVEPR